VRALLLLSCLFAQDKPAQVLATVKEHLGKGDSYAAVEYIQRQGAPRRVAELYSGLARYFLEKEKDLAAFVRLSQAGIHYELTMAQLGADAKDIDALRSAAKTLAYDLAAETWPGWGEGALPSTKAQQAIGRDAAKLNLRLARELKKGAMRESLAHWMLGAHELAAGDHERAKASFLASAKKAQAAGKMGIALSATGFLAITRIAAGEDEAGRKLLAVVKADLGQRAAEGDEDAAFYASQFDPALKAFAKTKK
jgi:hypothetical protein